jgi:glycosyl hydrolase family 25
MTIFFPDISSYEAGLIVQPGTVAVIAKATEGTYYRDAQYANFKAQAAHVGAVFSAYHFLKAGNGAGQADYCHALVGSTPVMLDVETEGTSKPTVQDCLDFINRLRALGGSVWGAYFPQWYWQQVGGNLASLGVAVVASNYTAYSDTGPGWAPYGGVTPALWQYTDKQPYGGQTMDFNAYKGTVQQLAALINGTTTPTPSTGGPVPNIPASIAQNIPDVAAQFPPNGTFDTDTALIWADARAAAAMLYAKQARDEVTALKAELDGVNGKLDQVLSKLGGISTGGVDEAALAADVVHGIGQKLAGA